MKIFTTEQIENRNKIIELIETGEALNLELAEQLCEGQGFDFEELFHEACGELLELANLPANAEGIAALKELELLDLSNKNLKTLPKGLGLLTYLDRISVSGNQLTDLTEISKITTLRVLYCSNNKITELPESLSQLENLEKILCSNNKITELSESLCKLLIELNCSNNQITAFPDAFYSIRKRTFSGNN